MQMRFRCQTTGAWWALGCAMLMLSGAAGADWPMFRLDPQHSGAVTETISAQLEVAWSRELGGSVDSSPAVVGGRVYVGNSLGQVHALDAADGSPLWSFATGAAVVSSPAVADGVVVFGSVDRFLYALDAGTGVLRWRFRTYGPIISSPVCSEGVVYFTSIGGRCYACRLADGEMLWSTERGAEIQSSPALGDGLVLYGDDAGLLRALRARDGSEVWRRQVEGKIVAAPVVGAGVVVFGVMAPSALRPPRVDCLLALRLSDGEVLWAYKHKNQSRSVLSAPLIAGPAVYFASVEGYLSATRVQALNLEDGGELWELQVGGVIDSSPALADGVLLVGCHDGNLLVISAVDGRLMQSVPLGPKNYSSPAVSEGRVYIGSSDGRLYCLR